MTVTRAGAVRGATFYPQKPYTTPKYLWWGCVGFEYAAGVAGPAPHERVENEDPKMSRGGILARPDGRQ